MTSHGDKPDPDQVVQGVVKPTPPRSSQGRPLQKPSAHTQTTTTTTTPSTSSSGECSTTTSQDGALTTSAAAADESSSSFSLAEKWARVVHALHKPSKKVIVRLSHHAAIHPKTYVGTICVFAMAVLAIGFFTGFRIESQEFNLWTPTGSLPETHGAWVESVTFDDNDDAARGHYFFAVAVHASGANVVTRQGVQRVFDVLNVIQSVPGYTDFCAQHGGTNACPPEVTESGAAWLCETYGIPMDPEQNVCEVGGVTGYFFHNQTLFETTVTSDEQVQENLGATLFPGQQKKFDISDIVGLPEMDETGTILQSGKMFLTGIRFPRPKGFESAANDLEMAVVDAVLDLRDEWAAAAGDDGDPYRVEVVATASFEEEFTRGMIKDIPLFPVVGIIMTAFTCLVFWKRGDPLHSRCLLGLGAVCCIGLSIFTGYGLMFLLGVPFTSLAQAVPFILFGIGLDDSFVIYLAYTRTDPTKDTVERIQDTMEDVATSIFMTTATSVFAFALGCVSAAPAIRWMCLYAAVTIAIDFVYQITFFISLLVLDEERIQNKRQDCCIWNKVDDVVEEDDDHGNDDNDNNNNDPDGPLSTTMTGNETHIAERYMALCADVLLLPWVKALVLLVFASFFALCAYSTTKLQVDFDFTSVLPYDSYIITFQHAMNDYSERRGVSPYIYFRFVDQSDIAVHAQMEAYVNEIVALEAVVDQPFSFWVRDYYSFVWENVALVKGLSFYETFHLFLADKKYDPSDSFVLDKTTGEIIASRTQIHMSMDPSEIDFVLETFRGQRQISREQDINHQDHGNDDGWAFFTFDPVYYLWEFISITVDELKLTTIIGVVTVSFMSMIFIPHWSGVLFVAPMVAVLYIDLLGFLQLNGVDINGVTYVTLVMSIGLLVDFVMHISLRFFESKETTREAKAKDVLRTMGTPVLLAGFSTFLGVLPLILSVSSIIDTIFVAFLGIVFLGITHGLILLPVILSLIGPE